MREHRQRVLAALGKPEEAAAEARAGVDLLRAPGGARGVLAERLRFLSRWAGERGEGALERDLRAAAGENGGP